MIPKPLNQIEWSDIEALRDSRREEDDTIEYKGSFKGGADFLAFNETKQAAAVDAIAKEVIAFLNTRGGDVVIGVKEYDNEHPKIEELTPLANVIQTVDRLAQALAALIGPTQSILGLRAVMSPIDVGNGVIVVRAQSSLRAPHRSRRTKECYVRRGRESVPMPMDEIQYLSIRKSDLRSEQKSILERLIGTVASSPTGRTNLPEVRFQVRVAYLPYQSQQIEVNDEICLALKGDDPYLSRGSKREQISVPYRELNYQFQPILRGRRSEGISRGFRGDNDFLFCSKDIRESGLMTADFACWVELGAREDNKRGLYHVWIAGFIANTLASFQRVVELQPELNEGFLAIGFFTRGQVVSRVGDGMWESDREWPQGVTPLPLFEIATPKDFLRAFDQVQTDAGSIIGVGDKYNWSLASDE